MVEGVGKTDRHTEGKTDGKTDAQMSFIVHRVTLDLVTKKRKIN